MGAYMLVAAVTLLSLTSVAPAANPLEQEEYTGYASVAPREGDGYSKKQLQYLGRERRAGAVPADTEPCEHNPLDVHPGAQRCGIPIGFKGRQSRTGSYYLHKDYYGKPSPVMILLHGSGFTGKRMIETFWNLADRYGFNIVAPDSYNDMVWGTPKTAAKPWTRDFYHIEACYFYFANEVEGVQVDTRFIGMVGNSRAGYTAPAFGSRSSIGVNSAIIYHAAADSDQMGPHSFPILWTTGFSDALYGPYGKAKDMLAKFRYKRPDFDITHRIWQGSHTIRNYTELDNTVEWWLTPETRHDPAPPLWG